MMKQLITRRDAIRLLAGGALLAAGGNRGFAAKAAASKTALIGRLIREARGLPHVSQRIDFISRALLGVRYQANTLIGGPKHPERFVVRDDAFDCVTFCEVVLAAAIARNLDEFETDAAADPLRPWQCAIRATQSLFCRMGSSQHRKSHLPAGCDGAFGDDRENRELAPRARQAPRFDHRCRQVDAAEECHAGSAGRHHRVHFRPLNLDFFHTGLVAFGKKGILLLRHASRSRGRVIEEPMARFVSVNPVKYVMLLRAAEPDAPATAANKT